MSLRLFQMNPRNNTSGVKIVSEKTYHLGGGGWSGMGPADTGTHMRETIVQIGPHRYSISEEYWSDNFGPSNGQTSATVIWPESAPERYAGQRHWQSLVARKGTGPQVRDAIIEELKTAPGRLHVVY